MNRLTQKRLKEVLHYNSRTGRFTWKINRQGNVKVDDVAGSLANTDRIVIRIDGKAYKAHRLAWLYVYGKWPDKNIDHINGIPSDNRIANLRDVTQAGNMQNLTKAHRDNKTGLLGVTLVKSTGKYKAVIVVGCFSTPEEAHEAYLRVKHLIHPTYKI